MNLLLVEDNQTLAKGLKYSLEQNGYEVIHKVNCKDTINYLNKFKVDFIILDINLPDGNGIDIYVRYIRNKDIRTIFLTAKDDENDIVKGLEVGADDYITKPFSIKELIARINRIVLREKKNIKIKIKDIEFDIDKIIAFKNNQEIKLTSLELKILTLLFTNINKTVKRDYIIEKVWEWTGNDINDNTVTVYLKRIREKLRNRYYKNSERNRV